VAERGWIKALGFDTDGVLVNADPVHHEAFNVVLAKHGIATIPWEAYKNSHEDYLSLNDYDFFQEYLASQGTLPSGELVAALCEEKDHIYEELSLSKPPAFYPGVVETLRYLKGRGVRLFDVTGSKRNEVLSHFRREHLESSFEFIVASEDVLPGRGKPLPDPYLLAHQKLNENSPAKLRPDDCVVAEDTPGGIVSAKQAGFYAMGIPNTTPAEALWRAGADLVVTALKPSLYDRLLSIQERPRSGKALLEELAGQAGVLFPPRIHVDLSAQASRGRYDQSGVARRIARAAVNYLSDSNWP